MVISGIVLGSPTLIQLVLESAVEFGAIAPMEQWAICAAAQIREADRPLRRVGRLRPQGPRSPGRSAV